MRRRRKALVVLVIRRLLTCAICIIALLGFLTVHIYVAPLNRLPRLHLNKHTTRQREHINYEKSITEQSSTRNLSRRETIESPFISNPKENLTHNQRLTSEHINNTHEISPPHFVTSPSFSKLNTTSGIQDYDKLWKHPPNRNFVPCVNPNPSYISPLESRGYLLVHTNGGLNQMRAGICDMVAIARIINATLVVPELDKRSFWQDTSKFSDVFDEDHFISTLSKDIRVIKKLPKGIDGLTKVVKHFKSYSGLRYYQNEIATMWGEYKVIRAAKSDSRLVNNGLPPDIQKLRCRACYEALRFSTKIKSMGQILVDRMRSYGLYIALHLRYEKDMLAFSGCNHGLSASEAAELRKIRKNTAYWKVKDIDGKVQRLKGNCPLTPKEVGILLAALGYAPNTPIYIAAGEIYGGESRLASLGSRFSMLMSKEKLATKEELKPFMNHSTQMAALDYIVSVESDVFIPSYSGNMARSVEGHRRFLGHRKTISPDRRGLVRLIDRIGRGTEKDKMNVYERIIEIHKTRQGSPRRRKGPASGTKGLERHRSEESFYENPLPDCLCQKDPSRVR
ncbi:O-fucosyltransferase family protein [Raphanus sativus]|uniref:O-fucosyltransferase family protein n=1 Tax=Raphanus sativus TaxID=3726 RepID=A0A6J0MDA8_RAPSA|nr:O-fucosyltransferase 7 [Raphanus sativus]KAJ4916407.1 O-fucosyltransferase family protein [Raphanus sativus]